MSRRFPSVSWRRLAPFGVGALLLVPAVPAAPGAAAQAPGFRDALAERTQPFEDGGAERPGCVPEDGTGFVVCKPTARAAALLPDGRVLYCNGVEAWENAEGSTFTSAAPS